MTFLNAHELLAYLVHLEGTDDKWRMSSGQQLGDFLRTDGRLDSTRPDQEYAELGRMLWALKQDGSVEHREPRHPRDPRPHGAGR